MPWFKLISLFLTAITQWVFERAKCDQISVFALCRNNRSQNRGAVSCWGLSPGGIQDLFHRKQRSPHVSPPGGGWKLWAQASDRSVAEKAAPPTALPQWAEQICVLTSPGRNPEGNSRGHLLYTLVVESRQGRRIVQSKQSENLWNTILQCVSWTWPYWEPCRDWDTLFALTL